MNYRSSTFQRSLSRQGQGAFVRASAFRGSTPVVAIGRRHALEQRPLGSLRREDRMHPGEGGA